LLASLTLCLLAGCLQTGCSASYWLGAKAGQTRFRVDPFTHSVTFDDTKNNNVDIDRLTIDEQKKVYELLGFRLVNNASDPIAAEVDRVVAAGQGQLSQKAYAEVVMSGVANVVEKATPALSQMLAALQAAGAAGQESRVARLAEAVDALRALQEAKKE